MQLKDATQAARWLRTHVRGHLHTDSRRVQAGDGFIAWPGAATDGRAYVHRALSQGASACLVEQEGVESYAFDSEKVASFQGLKAQTGWIADAYYEQPSRQLKVLAVTGTNGKTSVSWWLAQALAAMPTPVACGVVGTLGAGQLGQLTPTGLTTPDPVVLQQTLRQLADAGVTVCALEASSIGIVERRLDGTHIHTALFTNFTQDHLDYHGSMAAYWAAKAGLFSWPGLQAAVINIDDEQGAALAQALRSEVATQSNPSHHASGPADLWTVSCQREARLTASNIHWNQGLCFEVREGNASHILQTRLIGHYNVSNLLCVMAGLRSIGVSLADAVAACANLQAVPGRMACQGGLGQPLAVVDYAHTPDALEKALKALREIAQLRGGRLWCVFGCGGERDASKRPLMGAVAARYADEVVVTSDNPRSESIDAIISQILLGTEGHEVKVQPDRALAIAQSLAAARRNDVVLVAGKGHETTQDIAGHKLPFDDSEHVLRALQKQEQHA